MGSSPRDDSLITACSLTPVGTLFLGLKADRERNGFKIEHIPSTEKRGTGDVQRLGLLSHLRKDGPLTLEGYGTVSGQGGSQFNLEGHH